MKPTKHNGQTPTGDEVDHALDAALAKYAAVEPRMGLEDRVLARLHSEPSRSSRRIWWQWGLAGAAAAILVVGLLAWRSSRVAHPVIANHPPAVIRQPSLTGTKSAPPAKDDVATAKHTPRPKPAARRAPASTTVAARPKLDQFPSPQPLSAEEIALSHYVKNFPKEAQVVAQAQEDFAVETQKTMNDGGSDTLPSTSIQQER